MNGQNSMPYSPENQSTLVAGKKRIRSTSVCVWLSPDEQTKIRERMADVGIRNLSAYASLETTLVYAHADTEAKRKAIEKAMGSGTGAPEDSSSYTIDDEDLLKQLYGL